MTVSDLFLPKDLSNKLSSIGFNQPCLAKYNQDELILCDKSVINIDTFPICAPLWQQAFDWFLENYNLEVIIQKSKDNSFFISINGSYIVDNLDFKIKFNKSEVKSKAIEICLNRISSTQN